MIAGFILGGFTLLAAASLGLVERALGPDSGRFPCVNRELIWAARVLTAVLAARSFFVFRAAWDGSLPPPTVDQLAGAVALGGFFLLLLVQIIRQRLPLGVWRRLQARVARTQRVARDTAKGSALAKLAADGVPVVATMEGPEAVLEVVQSLRSVP